MAKLKDHICVTNIYKYLALVASHYNAENEHQEKDNTEQYD